MPKKLAERKAKATAKSTAATATAAAASAPVSRPDWPPLQPLVPTVNLALDTVLQDQIILVRNLFTASLCQRYVSFLSTLNLVTTPTQPKKGEALRVNDRFRVDDFQFAERLWSGTGLKGLVTNASNDWGGDVCGLNPAIRIYRYRKGQFFDQHCRCSSRFGLQSFYLYIYHTVAYQICKLRFIPKPEKPQTLASSLSR